MESMLPALRAFDRPRSAVSMDGMSGIGQRQPRLRRSDPSRPGFRRVRRGRGFGYLDQHEQRMVDDQVVARIRELAIPPAWEEVWICPQPNGHLQATGTDATVIALA